jgi:hypothetical protein
LKSSRGRNCLTPLSSARGRPFFTGAVTKLKSNAKFKAAFMAMPKAKREAMMKNVRTRPDPVPAQSRRILSKWITVLPWSDLTGPEFGPAFKDYGLPRTRC